MRVGRVQFKPIAVDQFRDPAPTPTEYIFTVTALVEGKVVDSASFRFVMEPGGTTTPTATSPLTRTPTSTVTSTTAAPTPGEWVLESIIPTTQPDPDWPDGSYTNHKVSIGDGTFSSSDSWKDRLHSGSRQVVCSWTSPPSYLKVGSMLSMNGSCQATDQRNGGGASTLGLGYFYLNLNPPADNLAARTSGATRFHESIRADCGGDCTSASDSKSGSIKIPEGKRGDVLVIVGTWQGPGGVETLFTSMYTAPQPHLRYALRFLPY